MSTKRRPDSDLNYDNWNAEDEPEESGVFQKASDEELSKRTIKLGKRRVKAAGSDNTEPKPLGNIFSAFGGFSKDNGKPISSTFSFLSSNSPMNGESSGSKKSETKSEQPTVGIMDDKNQLAYYGNLKGLNQSLKEWIKKKVDENPFCILTPIFEDYAKHLKLIQEAEKISTATSTATVATESDNKNTSTSTKPASTTPVTSIPAATTSAPTFTFASLTPSTTNSSKPVVPDTSKSLFTFGTKSPPESSKSTSTVTSSTVSTFSFGSLTSTAASSSSTGFSFGGAGSKPFTFGNVEKPTDSKKPSDSNETNDNADNDEPPKYEFVPVVEKDNFYSIKCKIFVKGEKGYSDRGVGMLYLKKVEGSDKTQLLVRADTSLGNILLNTLLSEGLPTQRMGKNNVMIICLPTPEAQGPSSVLIRVKNEEEADTLLAEIVKNKK